jgi:hypothetical protein
MKVNLDDFERLDNVDFDSASKAEFVYVDSNASTNNNGQLETSLKPKVTVDAPSLQQNVCAMVG